MGGWNLSWSNLLKAAKAPGSQLDLAAIQSTMIDEQQAAVGNTNLHERSQSGIVLRSTQPRTFVQAYSVHVTDLL